MLKVRLGEPGSGKTKQLIDDANLATSTTKGTVFYMDLTDKHLQLLDRNVRFASAVEYNISSLDALYGFICGVAAANYDISHIFIDSVEKIAINLSESQAFAEKTDLIAKKFDMDIVLSITTEEGVNLDDLKNYEA